MASVGHILFISLLITNVNAVTTFSTIAEAKSINFSELIQQWCSKQYVGKLDSAYHYANGFVNFSLRTFVRII